MPTKAISSPPASSQTAERPDCQAMVTYDSWGRKTRCAKRATRDGWCGTHHPDKVNARKQAHADRWAAERKEMDRKYARAEAAARIVKLARVWAAYLGTVAEGSASYTRDANRLSDAVAHYEKLLGGAA